jgi:hypothetical protein
MGRTEAEMDLDCLARQGVARDAYLRVGHPAVEFEYMRNARFVGGKCSKNKIFHGFLLSSFIVC